MSEANGEVKNELSIHKPNLLDEVRNVIRFKHYSIRTEESYVQCAKTQLIIE